MEKTLREIVMECGLEAKKRGVGKYSSQFRGKKIKLQDLLIFDGLYDPDKIKKEDFYENEDPIKMKRGPLILDLCDMVYGSDWYDPFWESVKGTGFTWHKWSAESKLVKDAQLITDTATIDDIHKLLITIVRMEHWNYGFVYRAARSGKIFAILNRIKELTN